MSGALLSLFDSLFSPSFRGVEFDIPDGDREAGRRVQRFPFPGRDGVVHQDLGGVSGKITVTGQINGDDYVRRAEALRQAFNTPGPGTLVHPWYGELEVVLIEPCPIRIEERRLRVATFSATFEPWIEQPKAPPDTFGELLGKVDALRSQVRAYLRRVLAPVRMALGVISAVRSGIFGIASVVRSVLRGISGGPGIVRSLLGSALGDLTSLFGAPSTSYTADRVYAAAAAVPAAAAAAGSRPALPMIAPGGGVTDPSALIEARLAVELLLATAGEMTPASPGMVAVNPGGAGAAALLAPEARAVVLATRLLCLAEACATTGSIVFESRQDAAAWQARLDAAISAAAGEAVTAALADPEAAGPMWRALLTMRSAVAADMHERIGRLPAVGLVTTPGARVPAWIVAQHLAGDDPGRVRAVMEDLVVRNRLAHPSLVPAETELEWLP